MREFKYEIHSERQPEILVIAYLPSEAEQKYIKSIWDKLFMRNPSMVYYHGWLETDDSKGFLQAGDVIFIGETPQDPNGVELYIKLLTSHNHLVRTYEVCSTKAAIKGRPIKTRRVFKLYSTTSL